MAKAYVHVAISFSERIDCVICENTLREEKKSWYRRMFINVSSMKSE